MFTRCSNCRTVFHITAAELRAADGTVICGACGTTFDALESLSETRPKDPPIIEAPPPAEPEPEAAAEAPKSAENGEEAQDEDEFLQELESLIGTEGFFEEPSPADDDDAGTPLMDVSPEPLHDEELAAGVSAEDGTLDEATDEAEFLVEDFETDLAEEDSRFDQALITEESLEDSSEDSAPDMDRISAGSPGDELDDPFLDPDSVFRIDDMEEDAGDEQQAGDRDQPDGDEAAVDPSAGGAAEPARPDKHEDSVAKPGWRIEPEADTEASEAGDGDAETPESAAALPDFAQGDRPRRHWLRVAVVLIVVFLLTGTWVHGQRGKLLRHPAGEAVLGPVYALLGMEVAPDWNPAEFRALQWQAVADGDRPDDLTVAVSFMNMASYAQPYPVIRIVLEDRFGRRVGMHDVPPAQYLPDHSRGSRIAGGGRLQTTVAVRDPGGQADGFRVDFCLELEGRGLVCGPEPFR